MSQKINHFARENKESLEADLRREMCNNCPLWALEIGMAMQKPLLKGAGTDL